MIKHDYYSSIHNYPLFLKVSETCNVNCTFCNQSLPNGKIMATDEDFNRCFSNLDYYLEKIKELKASSRIYRNINVTICMFGGEPMTNPKAIKKLCEHIKKTWYGEIDYDITMTTNGTIYDRSVLESMKDASWNKPISVMVSGDHSKCASDESRSFRDNGESIYETMLGNLELYRDALNEINGKPGRYVHLSSVVSKKDDAFFQDSYSEDIKRQFKQSIRATKKPLQLHNEETYTDELDEYNKWYVENFEKHANELLDRLNESTRDEILSELLHDVIRLGKTDECFSVNTIDASGNFNWCNKNSKCLNDDGTLVYDPERMKSMILNPIYKDKMIFGCSKEKIFLGNKYKSAAVARIFERFTSLYNTPTYGSLMVDPSIGKEYLKNLNNLVIYNNYRVKVNKDAEALFDDMAKANIDFVDQYKNLVPFVNNKGDICACAMYPEIVLTNLNRPHFAFVNQELYNDVKELIDSTCELIQTSMDRKNKESE